MGWIEFESMGLFCPDGADVFVGCKSSEGFEFSGEVVGVDEVGEVLAEVLMGFVVEAFDGRFFDGSVHAFDLAVGPGMFRLGQAMIDVGFGAGELEGMGAEEFSALEGKLDLRSSRAAIAGRGEMHSVVGEYRVDLVRHYFDEGLEEVRSNSLSGLLLHLDEGELGGPVDGDEEVKLALLGANLGDIDVEVDSPTVYKAQAIPATPPKSLQSYGLASPKRIMDAMLSTVASSSRWRCCPLWRDGRCHSSRRRPMKRGLRIETSTRRRRKLWDAMQLRPRAQATPR